MRIAAHQHQLLHGVRKSLRDVLRHHRDVPGDIRAREGAERATRDQDLAPGGNQDARQEADQRGLARGVGTDHPEDLTVLDGHAEIADGERPPRDRAAGRGIRELDLPELDQRGHGAIRAERERRR